MFVLEILVTINHEPVIILATAVACGITLIIGNHNQPSNYLLRKPSVGWPVCLRCFPTPSKGVMKQFTERHRWTPTCDLIHKVMLYFLNRFLLSIVK